MADGGVGFVLDNVKQLLMYNINLLGDAKEEVVGLKNDLEVFQGFIQDSSQISNTHNSHERQALVNNIRNIVETADDAISTFIVEMAKYQERSRFGKASHVVDHTKLIRSVAIEVRKIREAVDKIKGQVSGGALQPVASAQTRPIQTQREPPVVEEDEVVGFDEPAREIIGILRGDTEGLDIISIVGMPGLGKTTLANKIFKDENLDYEFIYRAWAFVSKDCCMEDVFISILRQMGDQTENMEKMKRSELVTALKKCLQRKTYLIVLDDVWNTDVWDALKVAFPNNKHSRILVTTRELLVAKHVNLDREPHYLKFLSEEESCELLAKKVFGKSKCPKSLEALLEKVAKNCGGLPLAIVVIAGILLNKKDVKNWWMQVADSVNELIVKDERRFLEVVARSFNSLSYNLQLCFLYFGLVPRGEFDAGKLLGLWISEGFIKEESRMGLENTAAYWLDKLIARSLVISTMSRSNGETKKCRVHDTLRVFCREEAERQNLYHEIYTSNLDSIGNYRRICVDASMVPSFSSLSVKNLRTFLTFSKQKITMEPAQLSTMVKAFKKIRVLEVSSIIFKIFPKELRNLALLRYLSFSCDFGSILEISRLWSLQTLIVSTSKPGLVFDEDIWKLYQLRHLKTNVSTVLPDPPETTEIIGKENLQTLSAIAPKCCTEKVFKRIPNIKKLGIRGKIASVLEDGSNLIDNFAELGDLTNLKLFNDAGSSSIVKSISTKFGQKVPKLTKLTLSGTFLDWKHITILGNLEMLDVLKLKDNAFSGDTWEENHGTFPSLRVLFIDRTDLKTWKATDGQFQCLARLVLKNCNQLEEVPSCFAHMGELQTLDIYCCSVALVRSARELKQKAPKVKLSIYPPDM